MLFQQICGRQRTRNRRSQRIHTRCEVVDVTGESKAFMGITLLMQLLIAVILGAAGVEVPALSEILCGTFRSSESSGDEDSTIRAFRSSNLQIFKSSNLLLSMI